QRGEATWYKAGLGACGFVSKDTDMIGALNAPDFDPATPNGNPNKNSLCKRQIKVYNDKNQSINIQVADKCPECKKGDIDLSSAAFQKLFSLDKGRMPIKWEWV
ncbi:RlpA-like double-psi beta-barrel-protein domain-containing protein-containing protein, partial [Dimargaris cristalligena]